MRTEDGCIIHECLNGEPEAFGVLVDKYKSGIYAYAYAKLGDFQDAQDVTQEVFLKAYRNLRDLRRWESFGFWLYRIASNLCKEWLTARYRRPDLESIEDQDTGTLDTASLSSYLLPLSIQSLARISHQLSCKRSDRGRCRSLWIQGARRRAPQANLKRSFRPRRVCRGVRPERAQFMLCINWARS